MKVQYGCGFSSPVDWVNFDASPTLRFERIPVIGRLYKKNDIRFPDNVRYGDILKGLPVAENCCDFVYCSHVLEHLALDSFYRALQNTRKILKPGGVFRLVVPDLEHSIALYQSSDSARAAIDFLQESLVGVQSRPRGIRALLKEHLGNSRHLWMWDFKSLAHEL